METPTAGSIPTYIPTTPARSTVQGRRRTSQKTGHDAVTDFDDAAVDNRFLAQQGDHLG